MTKTKINSSVQFSCSVVSDSLWPHESQHARPPCPSPTPGIHSDSWPSSPWCHPAISSSVVPFSSCPQSLPASKSSPMSKLFSRGGQSTGVSALASFLPKKSPGWSPLEWTGWIGLLIYRVLSQHTVGKNPPATGVQSLCQEDPLEKEMATHSSIVSWEIPWTKEPSGLQSMESQNSQTWLSH